MSRRLKRAASVIAVTAFALVVACGGKIAGEDEAGQACRSGRNCVSGDRCTRYDDVCGNVTCACRYGEFWCPSSGMCDASVPD